MIFNIIHPDNKLWLPLELPEVAPLLKTFGFNLQLLESSIICLERYTEPMRINLGNLLIEIYNVKDADNLRAILQEQLDDIVLKK